MIFGIEQSRLDERYLMKKVNGCKYCSPMVLSSTLMPGMARAGCNNRRSLEWCVMRCFYFDGTRYELMAWCIMPNHVHAIVQPLPGYDLSQITHSWKSFTAHEANGILQRSGEFWQPESYDHLIRDEADFQHCLYYLLSNPEKAGLVNWPWVGVGSNINNGTVPSGTGVPPVGSHGRDGHATVPSGTGVPPVSTHGRDGHATGYATWSVDLVNDKGERKATGLLLHAGIHRQVHRRADGGAGCCGMR